MLARMAELQLKAFENGGSGRIVFELGSAFSIVDTQEWGASMWAASHSVVKAGNMYRMWCRNARQAVRCWIWLPRRLNLAPKDIRVLIADLVWDERAAWSERRML